MQRNFSKAETPLLNTDKRDLKNLMALELYLYFYRLEERIQTGEESAEDTLQAWV